LVFNPCCWHLHLYLNKKFHFNLFAVRNVMHADMIPPPPACKAAK
jgi:hypothetical protein